MFGEKICVQELDIFEFQKIRGKGSEGLMGSQKGNGENKSYVYLYLVRYYVRELYLELVRDLVSVETLMCVLYNFGCGRQFFGMVFCMELIG